jgi:putative Mg2+ transporter-C (MgtC) family protein
VFETKVREGIDSRVAMSLIDVGPLTWEALLCCFLSGIIVGLERQLRGKPMGMRTSALICIGTYVFVAMTRHVSNEMTDPSRVIGQVITGIGFLGAGVILARHGAVIGVTSASAIWVLASIGVVIGVGFPWLGVKLAVLTVAILVGVDVFEHYFAFLQRGVHQKSERKWPPTTNQPPRLRQDSE